jgi:signal transduction histidine kinase
MQEEERPMKIELDIPPDLPRVYGDPERVRQVLDNLLENAYQYTEIGGTINLRMHPEGDMMQIDVKDNGIGITLEEQKRVFERFYRGEDPLVLATSGTGLGLSIVNSLVDMHKGSLKQLDCTHTIRGNKEDGTWLKFLLLRTNVTFAI